MAGSSLLIKKRLFIMLVCFTLVVLVLTCRVGWIQLVKGEEYQKMAYEQQTRDRVINPKRGTIYDRNGKELAISASVDTISVNPGELRKKNSNLGVLAEDLANILQMDKESLLTKFNKKSRYEIVKRRVEKETGDQVRNWISSRKVEGVNVDEDTKRYYPERNLAAQVIGFTGSDNQGLDGIEVIMDQYLKGRPGKVLSEVDAGGRPIPFNEEKRIEPENGLNVVLTIDETIQHFAEKAIEKAIDDNKLSNGAAAIVMDPRTGEILAMASKPDFDLNNPFSPPNHVYGFDPNTWKDMAGKEKIELLQKTVWRNKAVVDSYEPGSTFKAITSAAALEENVIRPDSPVTDATVTVGGHKINCWKPNAHGNETFTEGVYNSCNPVFVRVAQSLGIERFYKYVKAFGFFSKTGIMLPGEEEGVVHKKPTEVDMAVASFGQRFQITPIQLISAYAAIANGGNLMKPQIVKQVTDAEGNAVKKYEPAVVRNVISRQTANTLKTILEGVVSEGTGGNAYIKGYRVAGKTGTSETTIKDRYIASFSAFAPADNPVICALVILDYPHVYPHTGGMIAAPVAGKLVEDILNYLGVERRYTEKDKEMLLEETFVPEVRNKSLEEAKKLLHEQGLDYIVEGDGNNSNAMIVEQTPKPSASVPKKSVIILYTQKPQKETMVKMPDVLNMTVEEATTALNHAGLNMKAEGIGTSIKQNVEPGTLVPKGKLVEVEFRNLETVDAD